MHTGLAFFRESCGFARGLKNKVAKVKNGRSDGKCFLLLLGSVEYKIETVALVIVGLVTLAITIKSD
mgnify:CR=1 FL=1